MGKRITVYLNSYYENILNNLIEELSKRDEIDYNITDIIRMSLVALKKQLDAEKEQE